MMANIMRIKSFIKVEKIRFKLYLTTKGMMIEVLAGKSAAEHGMAHNASPFLYNSQHDSIKYFGDCLEAAGFNRYVFFCYIQVCLFYKYFGCL